MSKNIGSLAVMSLLIGMNVAPASADTIDEQQKEFMSQLAVAKNTHKITSKQADEIDKVMRDFSKAKRELRAAHGDVITAADEVKLNSILNVAAQKLEAMTKNQIPLEKNKAPKNQ